MIVPGGGFVLKNTEQAYSCVNNVSGSFCRSMNGSGPDNLLYWGYADWFPGNYNVRFEITVGGTNLFVKFDPEGDPAHCAGVSIGIGATDVCIQSTTTAVNLANDPYSPVVATAKLAYRGGIPGGYDYEVTYDGVTYVGHLSLGFCV